MGTHCGAWIDARLREMQELVFEAHSKFYPLHCRGGLLLLRVSPHCHGPYSRDQQQLHARFQSGMQADPQFGKKSQRVLEVQGMFFYWIFHATAMP